MPVSKGGRDGISNFIPLCGRHIASKGNRDLMEWGIRNRILGKLNPRCPVRILKGNIAIQ
ncbi:MAG: hypothetical protein QXU18_07025 [Thermoplasmatales archaeon]